MAQALVNNFNTVQENSFVSADNTQKNCSVDFAKIFDNTNKKNTNQSSDIKDIENDENTNKTKTLGDIKEKMAYSELLTENLKTGLSGVIEEIAVIETSEEESENDSEEDSEKQVPTETQAEETDTREDAPQQIITDEIIPENPDITEEEPTMYNKEMNTLENPTVTILLHSQMKTNVKLVNENASNENNEAVISKFTDKSSDAKNVSNQFTDTSPKEAALLEYNQTEKISSKSNSTELHKTLDREIVKDLNIQSINNESSNEESEFSDLMQKQTPQEQAAKVMIQGDIKVKHTFETSLKTVTDIKPTEVSANKIIEQISKQLDGMYNNSKLNIVLNPGTLGKVNLHITNTRDGLTAQFTVTTQDAKEILMKGLNGLKESLLLQGISVDSVSVRLEESDSDSSFDWTEQEGSKGGNKQQGARKQKEEEKPFEQMMSEIENDDNLV